MCYFITIRLSRIEIAMFYCLFSLPFYLSACESQYEVHIPVKCFKDNIASYQSLMFSQVFSVHVKLEHKSSSVKWVTCNNFYYGKFAPKTILKVCKLYNLSRNFNTPCLVRSNLPMFFILIKKEKNKLKNKIYDQ